MITLLKHWLIKYSPETVLKWAKQLKKARRRRQLKKQETTQHSINHQCLVADFKNAGLQEGDSVLVHCSLSKIGFVEGGAQTVVNALSEVIGTQGTLLFPSFPAEGRNKTHLEQTPFFDVRHTPSRMGVITEYFRTLPGVIRSLHPTDAVCARGPLAVFYTNSHLGQLTPYNEFSPFRKLCEKNGKILMLGTTLNGACVCLHLLEDAVNFKFPVYDERVFDVKITDTDGKEHRMKTKVHNPEYSAKRNGDALKPLFEKQGVLINVKIGEANSMMIDANKLLNVMIKEYKERGVTMYTPHGS